MTGTKSATLSALVLALFVIPGVTAAAAAEHGRTVSFFIEVPADGLSITHAGKGAIRVFPDGIQTLAERLPNGLALSCLVRDEAGNTVGLATELEDFSQRAEGMGIPSGEMVWDTYWTVVVMGRGSILLYEKEKLPPAVAKVFSETPGSGKDWVGEITASSSVGPGAGGNGVIVGGSGEFAGAEGSFQEIGSLRGLTSDGQLTATIELRIVIDN